MLQVIVRDLSAVEVPHISAHTFPVGSVLWVVVPDVVHVAVPSCLEGAASQVAPTSSLVILALYMTDSTLPYWSL